MWLWFFSLLISFPVSARWATPKDVGSVLQEYSMSVGADADGSNTTVFTQIWRIQTEEGKINGSVKEIEYNSFTDKVEVLEAKTINGKTVMPVSPSAIEDRDKGESRDYDAVKVKSLVFPQVQIGSVLVLKYKVRSTPAPTPGQYSMHFIFPIGVLVEKVELEFHSARPIYYDVYDPQGILRVRGRKNRVSVHLKRLIPGQVVGEKDPFFFPARFSSVIVTTEPDWHKFFDPLFGEYDKIIGEKMPAPLAMEIKHWKRLKDPASQLENVLEFISQHYRYFGDWRRVRGGYIPRHLAEIEKSRYGDCKDLSTLLTAILRQLGYKANVAFIERGVTPWINKPADKIANVGMFNHAITRAELNGKVWWLDPTNAVVSLTPYADIASKPAYVVSKETKGFERVPGLTPDQYQYTDSETYHFLKNRDVQVDVQADYRGMAAFRLAYGLLTNPREKMLFDIVDYYSDGQDLKGFKFREAAPSHRRLKDQHFDFQYTTLSITYQSPAGLFLPLKDGGLSGAFYETDGRESDLQLAETPLVHHSIKILKNVEGVGGPSVCELKSPWMDVRREVKYAGQDIQIVQDAIVKIPVILKKEYKSEAFRKLRSEAQKCYYRSGLLFKAR